MQHPTIHLPRSRFLALGGAAALAAGAGAIVIPKPALAGIQLPPGWAINKTGNITQLLYNGALVASTGGVVNRDLSGTLTCWGPKGPQLSMTLPHAMILGKPTNMGNGFILTPVSPGSVNYQGPYNQGNGSHNGNGTATINDTKWGQMSYDTGRGGGGGGKGGHYEGLMGCIVATVGGEIAGISWFAGALATLEAAGWVAAAIPPMAMLALGVAGVGVIVACLAAYVVCHEQ